MDKQMPKSFNEFINKSNLPVLVDFWAEWCGPCRMVSPVIERIAAEFKGKVVTIKINVDKKQNIAAQYQISSIPTIMMFFRGKVIMRSIGALSYENLRQEVEKGISSVNDSNRGR